MNVRVFISLLVITLGACGGSGSPTPITNPPPPPPSGGDRFEPNDDPASATPLNLPAQQVDLSISSASDEDFFSFTIASDSDVQINGIFAHASGDLNIRLLDSFGTQVATGDSSTDNEELTVFSLAAGDYVVRVFGVGGITNDYTLSITAVPTTTSAEGELFGDIMVQDLEQATVFGSGNSQTVALASRLLNVGTAPAPGDSIGNGTAIFRLLDVNGAVVASGTKGPIFFTDNGGCDVRPDIFNQWLAAGSPHIAGTLGVASLTSPGCIDFYRASTNNNLDTPLQIGDVSLVPDGDYFYELEFDASNIYDFEPDFARANNSGAVPISISSIGTQREVTITGPIIRSGELTVETGIVSTTIGNGAALAGLPTNFNNNFGIERSWGVARNSLAELFYTLWDDGSLCKDNGDGTSSKVIVGLDRPMVFDFLSNDDVVIADYGSDQVLLATSASNYSNIQTLSFPGFTIDSPTAARVGADGLIYVSNSGNHEVLRLNLASGAAERVAGMGIQGFSGDGNAAASAQLSFPIDIDVTNSGLMVIADGHNNRLRVANLTASDTLSVAGITLLPGQIDTLAGTGPTSLATGNFDNEVVGFRGDRQHARSAILDWPFAPRVLDDRIFFVDADNHRIRMIDEFGTIHLVAGNTDLPSGSGLVTLGSENIDVGDGNNGLNATLNRVMDINVTDELDTTISIDIGDTDNYRIRDQRNIALTVTPYF